MDQTLSNGCFPSCLTVKNGSDDDFSGIEPKINLPSQLAQTELRSVLECSS